MALPDNSFMGHLMALPSELRLLTHSLVTGFLSVAALLSDALLVCCLQLVSKQPGSAGLLLLRIHLFDVFRITDCKSAEGPAAVGVAH